MTPYKILANKIDGNVIISVYQNLFSSKLEISSIRPKIYIKFKTKISYYFTERQLSRKGFNNIPHETLRFNLTIAPPVT